METPLGKATIYTGQYDSKLLVSIPRSLGKNNIDYPKNLLFQGVDLWNCYEFSWLDENGKPHVRVLTFSISAESSSIVESKSLKLYLNSFNDTKFNNEQDVINVINNDLTQTIGSAIKIHFVKLSDYNNQIINQFDGKSIDNLNVTISEYKINLNLLKLSNNSQYIEETLFSDLLKSNCLITNQPDWASLQIKYKGQKIDHESLLRYIISFRNHNEFHEQCVERIFGDIMRICKPDSLTIFAKYTRRGGIDINPIRTTEDIDKLIYTKSRDIRQ